MHLRTDFELMIAWSMYLVASLLIWKIISFFLPMKKEKWKNVILLFCCTVLCMMVIFIGDPVNLPPTILVFLTGVLTCCGGSLLSRFTIGCMVASIALSFNALADNYLPVYEAPYGGLKLLFWALIFLLMKRYKPEKDYELAPSLWKLLLFLTMIPIGIVVTLVVVLNEYVLFLEPDQKAENVLFACFILLCIALFSNIGLMWTITILIRHTKLEQQQFLGEMNRSYYANMEAQQFEIRRLKHDLGNHLHTMLTLQGDRRETYLKGLIDNTVFQETLQYCGDSTINAVLNNKKEQIRQHQIRLVVKADIAEELPFVKPDICAILANLLDNAIEACDALEISGREIRLDMTSQKGLFVLKMDNPVSEAQEKITFQTTKKDAVSHGFGLKSVKEVVKRYNGRIEIEVKNKYCQVLLYLPV